MTTLFHPIRPYTHYLLLVALWPVLVSAGISLDSTRLIVTPMDQGKGARIGIMSEPESLTPYLVRVKTTTHVQEAQGDATFVVVPPVFRLEPGHTQQLRVMPTRTDLPSDRETLFYLSASALPATSEVIMTDNSRSQGQLIVATGNIIKLFYRPNGLLITQRDAMGQLQFTHQGTKLVIKNPSPYYITLAWLLLGGKGVPITKTTTKGMIAPFSQITVANVPTQVGLIQWAAINDFGGREEFSDEAH
ncbi:fimbrial biogenesis chaperone [Morganella morganii]|uniref:fimbrial biogenesis chaperone n=1 Tax=Morganella morganii TaxID=582 RepID=UPI000469C5CF|nr:molecular chaperone [Morganella morganii]